MLKYFSFKLVFDGFLPSGRPSILVAPPHGVFPYGNLLTMLAFPSLFGFPFTGVAASAALTTPIFRQILQCIGVEEASAKCCAKILSEGRTLGVSTGGVAEVFQTEVVDR
jgi:1-acyl-sn-glycerol-3-phosphate acyltransferase